MQNRIEAKNTIGSYEDKEKCSLHIYYTHRLRKAFFRRNSRHLRRLSRLYDWEVDEHGHFRPIVDETTATRVMTRRAIPAASNDDDANTDVDEGAAAAASTLAEHRRAQYCANDSYILETILRKYNRHKIPGGQVRVEVEVWVQEITTISDITSDFQVRGLRKLYDFGTFSA